MDATSFIKEIGGGLSAVVIVVLSIGSGSTGHPRASEAAKSASGASPGLVMGR